MTENVNEQVDKEKFVRAYGAMVLSRTFDKKIVTAQRQGRVGFYTPTMGQEATQIGASLALDKDDLIFQYYRDVPMMIHRGVPMEKLLDQIMGNGEDYAKGRQMPSHFIARDNNFMSIQSPVASNLPLATGAGYALKYRKKNSVVLTTFGDGSTSTPDFHAAMNMAAVYDLPVIFLCENNQWAISLPIEKQTRAEIWKKAEGYGMEGVKVDGNDLFATFKATSDAVKRARDGKGPTLIEAVSFRMGPHSTSDDPNKYRSNSVQEGSDMDPIIITENTLKGMGILNDAMIEKIRSEAERIVTEKFEEREKIPPPEPSTMFDDVYEEMSWTVKEERGEIL
ncbi:thiamine pyrophosphate-dependent dehydrogenase E1 component subunit alpha [Oxyplasma meridianum]|uniref:Thiamine pyrophosphate-dependent dehydrogenase E1 component subunit alpha n=1 Tax=Oxyplasma meridianum TaxID=3073602 RepID=A0AAX4NIK2_9ARCH